MEFQPHQVASQTFIFSADLPSTPRREAHLFSLLLPGMSFAAAPLRVSLPLAYPFAHSSSVGRVANHLLFLVLTNG
jgi:hypothetical protein